MSAQILSFRVPEACNDNQHYKYISNALNKAVMHIEHSAKFIEQMQQPEIFHPHDTPSIDAYLKMSLVLMERASETIHDVLTKHKLSVQR